MQHELQFQLKSGQQSISANLHHHMALHYIRSIDTNNPKFTSPLPP
jgi:hypothetical protein